MTQVTKRNLSVLGIVLLAASAVTAAVMPSNIRKATTNPGFISAESTDETDAVSTCRSLIGNEVANCTHTETGNGPDLSSTTGDTVESNPGSSSNDLTDTGTGTNTI